jgi:hypothetical protein
MSEQRDDAQKTLDKCVRHFRLFRYTNFTGEQVANLLVTGEALVGEVENRPTLEDLRGVLFEFLKQASLGNVAAGAEAAMCAMEAQAQRLNKGVVSR